MIKQYIVDAFAKDIFHGNQAAICVLDKYHLRWFSPGGEIEHWTVIAKMRY